MAGLIKKISLATRGQGLYEFTREVENVVSQSADEIGLCTIFTRHTSCSLLIQENADPSARHDLENWLNRLVPENDSLYTHIYEGADDMPAHIKSMLTATQLSIPIERGQLVLGTWQGIFLWEHRHAQHQRQVILHLI
ncbi:YjbQ family protein [Aliikangiella marina]|uniref:YjbQ family protein n=1 Tax=Aliikangiella marina TaxID=1712262 RepID=A0A545TH93_9GAMM|nr:secondary thiamine-phosphate synthase enzyme YjbQ [Aliikangiella marina]TQV76521.1 YjbQ family protein [Aliikangiella marina]